MIAHVLLAVAVVFDYELEKSSWTPKRRNSRTFDGFWQVVTVIVATGKYNSAGIHGGLIIPN